MRYMKKNGEYYEKNIEKELVKYKNLSDKHLSLFLLVNQWLEIKQKGHGLSEYFNNKGYHEIAIYGMSYLGQSLLHELENSDVIIRYGIDSQPINRMKLCNISPLDEWPMVDVVVVTATTAFESIKKEYKDKISCPIISLEEVVGYVALRC